MRAEILRLVSTRGFGFARIEESGEEVFLHASALREGDFERLDVGSMIDIAKLEQTSKGLQARRVALVS
jgi:cold shock CspA family protein